MKSLNSRRFDRLKNSFLKNVNISGSGEPLLSLLGMPYRRITLCLETKDMNSYIRRVLVQGVISTKHHQWKLGLHEFINSLAANFLLSSAEEPGEIHFSMWVPYRK